MVAVLSRADTPNRHRDWLTPERTESVRMEKLLKMEGITKSFFGVSVLKGVDFDLDHGEVHVLLGENGAGKSTLMKILSGAYQLDTGSITLDGQSLTSPLTIPRLPRISASSRFTRIST